MVDEDFALRLAKFLKKSANLTDVVTSAESCLNYAQLDNYSLIVLDTDLDTEEEFSTLRSLRMCTVSCPILVISDKRAVTDRVSGLDEGADDYLCKPFAVDEFLARVRALMRRRDKILEFNLLTYRDIHLDLNNNELICNDHIIRLGLKEFRIMKLLINSSRQILPKDVIVQKVWGANYAAEYNNIEVYISFIRKKIKKIGSHVTIHTIRGIGYRLD